MDKLQSKSNVLSEIVGYWKEQWSLILGRLPNLVSAKAQEVSSYKNVVLNVPGVKLSKKSTDAVSISLKKKK